MQYYNMLIHPQTLDFLKWLEDFNDKKFFELYKPLYLKIKEQFEWFITSLLSKISNFDETLTELETKKCTYHIYKDMRFPRNRTKPYKINIGANMSQGWKKSTFPGYYIHIQNNASFFGWWVFFIQPKTAYIIRKYIYKNRKEFEKIINNPDFIRTFWSVISYQPHLKKVPKDFEDKHPSIPYILHRDRLVSKKLTNKSILSQNLETNIVKYAKILSPLNNFLSKAIQS
jgi:uncharacterized protein (TIGR02453 family)